MLSIRSAAALAVILATPTLAFAGPNEVTGRFHYTGDVEGAFTDGTLDVNPAVKGYTIHATEKRKKNTVEWSGVASLVTETRVLTIVRGAKWT